mmetsp:Transcript_8818/g.19381  ORF Transcript_8818/g.19381 Transcript_8818/m.19381 type:complete len:275 (-) Transcript_8818:83-907(-)
MDEAEAAAAEEAQVAAAEQRKEQETGAMVAQANGKLAIAVGLMARSAEGEAAGAGRLANSSRALRGARARARLLSDAEGSVRASAVRAAVYAHSASLAAKKAKEELDEIKKIPQEAAQEVTSELVAEIWREANVSAAAATATEAELEFPSGGSHPEVASRVAAPYHSSAQREENNRAALAHQATQLKDKAESLRRGAQILASQAVGNDAATKRIYEMLRQANGAEAEAENLDIAALAAASSIPDYQAKADEEAARAIALAKEQMENQTQTAKAM